MQLLVEGSDEGSAQGLGLVPGRARLLQGGEQRLRVPHMGWNQVTPVRPSALFDPQADEQRFYFVHSYFVDCAESGDVSAVANYGHPFAASLERGRVMGVQFHPEKSHRYGMTLVRRFIALTP
jgi:glutamine amidotransferase